ncbi:hypothetical protein DUI87_24688 [Hirundo rustica rustica]|uniref:Helicase C-terminal domain-containing protein n=1 Tax=Hirundo rustica rustica TaxID=333673 RepID=A0A3M0JCD5_HIRRU|nr:hypothetical protein DUI87_24688 [Hirundo rustica rustica]
MDRTEDGDRLCPPIPRSLGWTEPRMENSGDRLCPPIIPGASDGQNRGWGPPLSAHPQESRMDRNGDGDRLCPPISGSLGWTEPGIWTASARPSPGVLDGQNRESGPPLPAHPQESRMDRTEDGDRLCPPIPEQGTRELGDGAMDARSRGQGSCAAAGAPGKLGKHVEEATGNCQSALEEPILVHWNVYGALGQGGQQVLEAFAGRLIQVGVLSRREIPSLTKYQIILARDQYRKNPSAQHGGIHQGVIEGDFALCISLYHGYELLLQMGIRSLFIYLWGIMDGSKGLSRTKNELGRNEDFMKLYQQLQDMFSDAAVAPESASASRSTTEKKKEFVYSHPKLKKLEEIVLEHFKSWKQRCSADGAKSESSPGDTRVMIFSSFRDSVQEIAEMLARLSPAVRAMTFVGHSSGKSTKGFTQKEQLEVVRRFREGGYNTLVSTCVGEEGLDIGEVDLIVCFDAQRSPVRLVQRMGRTGRRRHGRIVVILAQGREERMYNQSQCNKRSIHKAISGNKTLRFYQHSPRMVPEGINPKVHKMFITAEEQEPSTSRMLSKERRSSSLQHRSALFACGQKQVNSHESWSLSPEEFEIWDRLYRIKEGDGIKEPVLPRVRFETLENLEETPKPREGAARELSLSEWSVWQNQPLPTSLVDHSDRCHLFISAMEMMELMRHQQGDCSYERELQPHLQMEDVNIPGNRRNLSRANPPWDQRALCSRKDLAKSKPKPFPPDTGDSGSEFFATFKITKPKAPRRAPGLREEVPVSPQDPSASSSGARLAVAGHSDQDEGLEVTFDLNAFIDLCDNSDSPETPASPAAQGHSPAGEPCGSLGRIHGDSGYETSPVASELFYLPESCRDPFELLGPPQEPPGLEQTLSQVQRLLSQSPPSGHELEGLESVMGDEGTRSPSPKVLPDGHSEALQDSGSPTTDPSLLLLENPKVAVPRESRASGSPRLSRAVSSSQAAAVEEEQLWNDSFDDLFDSEEFPENSVPGMSHPLTNGPPKEPPIPRDTGEAALEAPGEEQSLHLFEDEDGEDVHEGSPESTEPPARAAPAGTVPGAQGGPGRELPCAIPAQPCRESMDHPYDCSRDLFSITFDLGFSIEDSGEETSEETGDADNPKVNGAPGNAPGAESTEGAEISPRDGSRLETSPGWDCSRLGRRKVSTPLSLQSRGRGDSRGTEGAPAAGPGLGSGGSRTGREPPEPWPAALLTPTSRKGVNVKAGKRIPMKVFSNAREQIPEVPPMGPGQESPRRKSFGRSAMNSPSGRRESLEDTKLPGSRGSPAAGRSSDSEEEIIFQRKNRMKKNVLKSPDAAGRQFLEEEAELSLLDAEGISSDESDGAEEELSPSLARFLNDDGEPTQALNDTEMRGVYLSSVRSPALGSRYKMVHREFNPAAVFSQIPEQDSAYAEDSFCVGDEEEEAESGCSEEEVCVDFALLPSQAFGSSSSRQYLTRRRTRLEQAGLAGSAPAPLRKKKPSRIVLQSDSSEEEVCSLGSSDYIVSNRLAVDRLLQSELQSPGNRNKLSQRLQRLQGVFERICVIVETDRVRPGETSRFFQRTQHYDGVLSALVQAGIRILFSSCQEETAALLKDLALLEHRKDAALQVPTELQGHRRDILSFFLSIPNLSYGAALNLCHSFGSITAVANSSVPALAAGSRLSRPQAEELHRFLRHRFDLQLLPQPLPAKGKS